jgi:molybdopterin-containing oxidoreductase family iron-sulfur binding subunit
MKHGFDRRHFLELMGASLALSGIVGCTQRPRERVLPHVRPPRGAIPWRARTYATTLAIDGDALGVLIETRGGRPTKIEGNPDHPASLGAAGVLAQASIRGLYDPDRARRIQEGGHPRTWRDVVNAFGSGVPFASERRYGRGSRLHLLLEPTSSPLIGGLLASLRAVLPEATVHYSGAFGPAMRWDGARTAFGRVLETQYDLRGAKVVFSFDADFLGNAPFAVRHQRDFMDARRARRLTESANRLYVVEPSSSITGATADHRLRRRPSEIPALAAALLAEIARSLPEARRRALPSVLDTRAAGGAESVLDWVRAAARDLSGHPGASVVIAGDGQPADVHALVHAMNELLGNTSVTAKHTPPPYVDGGAPTHDLERLADALGRGEVETLVVLEGNPVHAAPGELGLEALLARAPRRLYLGAYENETARACPWFVPALHYLESWGDARARDGTASFVQPLVAPLYGGRTTAELLAIFLGHTDPDGRALLCDFWRRNGLAGEAAWEQAIGRGVLPASAFRSESAGCVWPEIAAAVSRIRTGTPSRARLELHLPTDDEVHDAIRVRAESSPSCTGRSRMPRWPRTRSGTSHSASDRPRCRRRRHRTGTARRCT